VSGKVKHIGSFLCLIQEQVDKFTDMARKQVTAVCKQYVLVLVLSGLFNLLHSLLNL